MRAKNPETAKAEAAKAEVAITITPPNFQIGEFKIQGTAPYVGHKFSQKAKEEMLQAQMKAGGTRGKKKDPRDPDKEYLAAIHIGETGKYGIPAASFRSAMIDACRAAGYQMTKAKMSIFCIADDIDVDEGTPLVFISGTPEKLESAVRLESGVASISIRPIWRFWEAVVRIRWDADQFRFEDVANLLARAGMQVGIGEGRPFSKKSHGMGWGTFELI